MWAKKSTLNSVQKYLCRKMDSSGYTFIEAQTAAEIVFVPLKLYETSWVVQWLVDDDEEKASEAELGKVYLVPVGQIGLYLGSEDRSCCFLPLARSQKNIYGPLNTLKLGNPDSMCYTSIVLLYKDGLLSLCTGKNKMWNRLISSFRHERVCTIFAVTWRAGTWNVFLLYQMPIPGQKWCMNGHGNQQNLWLWLMTVLDWTNMTSWGKLWTLELYSPVQVYNKSLSCGEIRVYIDKLLLTVKVVTD